MVTTGIKNLRGWFMAAAMTALLAAAPGTAQAAAPSFQGLGDLPGGTYSSYALGVSADGSVLVGSGSSALGQEAFMWDALNGMQSLKNLLEDSYGLDLTGWTLWEATGISADGRTIVGTATNPDGLGEAWIAHIPEPATMWLLTLGGLGLLGRRRQCRGKGFPLRCVREGILAQAA